MNIQFSNSADGQTRTIVIGESFMFDQHREFFGAYSDFVRENGEVRINMAVTSYLDSAGLGMLMVLLKHANKHQQKVIFTEVQPAARHILNIASFGKLFTIE